LFKNALRDIHYVFVNATLLYAFEGLGP
jgi:hypothetical protein